MRSLYPEIRPYKTEYLSVGDIHTLYLEQSGNPDGKPVIYLHGGPGMGCTPAYRQFFDPEKYRIILFDQRGCGKSTPHACLEENTTWDLVDDMEKIRKHLAIDQWQVYGGSWGSTLAIIYAQSFPQHVSQMIIRGIFLCRKKEIQWMYQEGANFLYPDYWERYLEPVAEQERGDLLSAYHRLLTTADKATQLKAACAWGLWETSMLNLHSSPDRTEHIDEKMALALARIECHYFKNAIFVESDDTLLNNIDRIRHIPAVIIQGRQDVITPTVTAWELHRAWPEAHFEIIADACHAYDEPGIIDALVRATDSFVN